MVCITVGNRVGEALKRRNPNADVEAFEMNEEDQSLTALENSVLWVMILLSAAFSLRELKALQLGPSITWLGMLTIWVWFKMNPWILKERVGAVGLFEDGEFRRIGVLYVGVGMALLPFVFENLGF